VLRAVLALLIVCNLLFFVWARGWLEPALPAPLAGQREPQRLAAQVYPERVTVMAPTAATAAITAAQDAAALCLEAGPFDDASIAAAEAAVAETALPAGTWERIDQQPVASFLAYAGKFADPAARRRREDELKRLNLAFEPLDAPPELAPGLVLSRHAERAAADAAVAAAASAGLRGARVVAVPPGAAQHWLRAARAGTEAQVALLALQSTALGSGFRACAAAAR
jgi:hypothetical protein